MIALFASLTLLKVMYRWAVHWLADLFSITLAQFAAVMVGGLDFMLLASQISIKWLGFVGSMSVGMFSTITSS